MYNRVIFMGRLTHDPEIRTTQNGITMCRFSIAVERSYQKGQEKQTDFFDVICWRNTAEFVSKYFRKGQMIHIEGTMQNDNYTDQNGVKQYRMKVNAEKVDFCGDKPQYQQGQPQYQQGQPQYQQGQPQYQQGQPQYQQGQPQYQQGQPQYQQGQPQYQQGQPQYPGYGQY